MLVVKTETCQQWGNLILFKQTPSAMLVSGLCFSSQVLGMFFFNITTSFILKTFLTKLSSQIRSAHYLREWKFTVKKRKHRRLPIKGWVAFECKILCARYQIRRLQLVVLCQLCSLVVPPSPLSGRSLQNWALWYSIGSHLGVFS